MSTNNVIKIKKLLDLHVPGTILLASWLEANGFSRDLQHRYKRSGWLESVGVGAFKRPNVDILIEREERSSRTYSVKASPCQCLLAGRAIRLAIVHYLSIKKSKSDQLVAFVYCCCFPILSTNPTTTKFL